MMEMPRFSHQRSMPPSIGRVSMIEKLTWLDTTCTPSKPVRRVIELGGSTISCRRSRLKFVSATPFSTGGRSMTVPSAVIDLWRKRFYPEFRDLCIEAEYLNKPLAELKKWEIPLQLRSLPLRKTAPQMSPGSAWGKKGRSRNGQDV